MSETPPTRKVVRRVVRKPVVVPGSEPTSGARPLADEPTVTLPPAAPAPEPAEPRGPSRLSRAAASAARAGRSGSSAAARALRSGTTRARAWRLPAWPDVVWAAVVGGVLGLLATATGAGAMELFSALRGVSTGGGRWGTLAVLLVVALVLVVGELALRVLRVPQPRAIGFTAICLVLIAILGLFLDVAASMWAWLLLPALGAAAYALATWLLGLGRAEPSA